MGGAASALLWRVNPNKAIGTVPEGGKAGDHVQVQVGSGLAPGPPLRLIVACPDGLDPLDDFKIVLHGPAKPATVVCAAGMRAGTEVSVEIGDGVGRLVAVVPEGLEAGDAFKVQDVPTRLGVVVGDQVTDEEEKCLNLRVVARQISGLDLFLTCVNAVSGVVGLWFLVFIIVPPVGYYAAQTYSIRWADFYSVYLSVYVAAWVTVMILVSITFAVDGGHDHEYALFAWGRTPTFFYIWLVWYFALLAVRCWMAHTFRTFYKLLKKIGVARMRDLHWANKCG
mmetsp:Transcript_7491/g.23607  ORF Transcript_7491/g.23607 Transcript_7491/m.23607 type:complete len:282 (+) Transcript_7491:555-1400(+)